MKQSLWSYYIEYVLALATKNLSVLVVDNLNYYVLDESANLVLKRLGSNVCPLLANMTAFCQLLDIGVMGPLKAKIGSIWLANITETKTTAEKQKSMVELTIEAFKKDQ
jgi:heme oxygenase